MKTLYSTLITTVAFVVFAAVAVGDSGTTWDKVIKDKSRFRVLKAFNNKAVLDTETGRVWEQSPDTNTRTWFSALEHCYQLEVGGRKGWRLPTIEELASLVDTSQPAPTLPADHPFSNVSRHWSATSSAALPILAWGVAFRNGNVVMFDKASDFPVWCVRGGQGIDGVQSFGDLSYLVISPLGVHGEPPCVRILGRYR